MSTKDIIKGIGGRLRAERERLDLSQSLLAAQLGINRMSQANYESGKRSPDAEYLSRAAMVGMDVTYVVTGRRENAPDFYRIASGLIFQALDRRTGWAVDLLRFITELISELAIQAWIEGSNRPDDTIELDQWVDFQKTHELIDAAVENDRLLRDIFGSINYFLSENAIQLSAEKRFALVMMVFRSSRARDKIDETLIAEAVGLVVK